MLPGMLCSKLAPSPTSATRPRRIPGKVAHMNGNSLRKASNAPNWSDCSSSNCWTDLYPLFIPCLCSKDPSEPKSLWGPTTCSFRTWARSRNTTSTTWTSTLLSTLRNSEWVCWGVPCPTSTGSSPVETWSWPGLPCWNPDSRYIPQKSSKSQLNLDCESRWLLMSIGWTLNDRVDSSFTWSLVAVCASSFFSSTTCSNQRLFVKIVNYSWFFMVSVPKTEENDLIRRIYFFLGA